MSPCWVILMVNVNTIGVVYYVCKVSLKYHPSSDFAHTQVNESASEDFLHCRQRQCTEVFVLNHSTCTFEDGSQSIWHFWIVESCPSTYSNNLSLRGFTFCLSKISGPILAVLPTAKLQCLRTILLRCSVLTGWWSTLKLITVQYRHRRHWIPQSYPNLASVVSYRYPRLYLL